MFIASILVIVATTQLTGCLDAEPTGDEEPSSTSVAEGVFAALDPAAAYASLGTSERRQFDAVMTPDSLDLVESEDFDAPESLAAYTGCWGRNQTFAAKAAAGNTLYTYWQTTRVCVTRGRVTSVAVTYADGETSTVGWRIDKAPTKSTRNVIWEGRGNARYYFVLGTGGWDILHPVNCIQLRLNADGYHYRAMKSCNLDAS
jgi:hypothetical protein